jgi:DNA-binding SARP family transcriptional activator
VELRIQAELELGRHGELVAELEGLAAEHPLREPLRGLLMLTLYRSGRQAEALEAYRGAYDVH